jgi:hypothetical protein
MSVSPTSTKTSVPSAARTRSQGSDGRPAFGLSGQRQRDPGRAEQRPGLEGAAGRLSADPEQIAAGEDQHRHHPARPGWTSTIDAG